MSDDIKEPTIEDIRRVCAQPQENARWAFRWMRMLLARIDELEAEVAKAKRLAEVCALGCTYDPEPELTANLTAAKSRVARLEGSIRRFLDAWGDDDQDADPAWLSDALDAETPTEEGE